MNKVGIVSCYFQENYGSMLQAYATQKILDDLGYENENINIDGLKPEINKAKAAYFAKAALTSDILFYKIGKALNKIRVKVGSKDFVENTKIRHRSFEKFKNTWFKVSCKYESKEELKRKCSDNYHTVLVGSDQLWLPANIAADYYTLNFVPDCVNTIAYATSFGQSELPKDVQEKAKYFLKRIRHISVREESGQKLVKNLVGRDIPVVCDATLLFSAEQWMEIQPEKAVETGDYIFCYFLGNNPKQREFAKRLKDKTGMKIIALPHLPEYKKCDEGYADKELYDVNPGQFVNLIRNAKYVCTDSFHCSVFSILYKRDFFTFRRFTKETKVSTNSRLDTLFHVLGIKNPILMGDEKVEDCMNYRIDYNNVQNNLIEIRGKSLQYLKKALLDTNEEMPNGN